MNPRKRTWSDMMRLDDDDDEEQEDAFAPVADTIKRHDIPSLASYTGRRNLPYADGHVPTSADLKLAPGDTPAVIQRRRDYFVDMPEHLYDTEWEKDLQKTAEGRRQLDQHKADVENLRLHRGRQGDPAALIDPAFVDNVLDREERLNNDPRYQFVCAVAAAYGEENGYGLIVGSDAKQRAEDILIVKQDVERRHRERRAQAKEAWNEREKQVGVLQKQRDIVVKIMTHYMPEMFPASVDEYTAAWNEFQRVLEARSVRRLVDDVWKWLAWLVKQLADDHDVDAVADDAINPANVLSDMYRLLFERLDDAPLKKQVARVGQFVGRAEKQSWNPRLASAIFHVVSYLTATVKLPKVEKDAWKPSPAQCNACVEHLRDFAKRGSPTEYETQWKPLVGSLQTEMVRAEVPAGVKFVDNITQTNRRTNLVLNAVVKCALAGFNGVLDYTNDFLRTLVDGFESARGAASELLLNHIAFDDAQQLQRMGYDGSLLVPFRYTLKRNANLKSTEGTVQLYTSASTSVFGRNAEISVEEDARETVTLFLRPPMHHAVAVINDARVALNLFPILPRAFVSEKSDGTHLLYPMDSGRNVPVDDPATALDEPVIKATTMVVGLLMRLAARTLYDAKPYQTLQVAFDALEKDPRLSVYDTAVRLLRSGWERLINDAAGLVDAQKKTLRENVRMEMFDRNVHNFSLGAPLVVFAKELSEKAQEHLALLKLVPNESLQRFVKCAELFHVVYPLIAVNNVHRWLDVRLAHQYALTAYALVREYTICVLEICTVPAQREWEKAQETWERISNRAETLADFEARLEANHPEAFSLALQRAFSPLHTGRIQFNVEMQAMVESGWNFLLDIGSASHRFSPACANWRKILTREDREALIDTEDPAFEQARDLLVSAVVLATTRAEIATRNRKDYASKPQLDAQRVVSRDEFIQRISKTLPWSFKAKK